MTLVAAAFMALLLWSTPTVGEHRLIVKSRGGVSLQSGHDSDIQWRDGGIVSMSVGSNALMRTDRPHNANSLMTPERSSSNGTTIQEHTEHLQDSSRSPCLGHSCAESLMEDILAETTVQVPPVEGKQGKKLTQKQKADLRSQLNAYNFKIMFVICLAGLIFFEAYHLKSAGVDFTKEMGTNEGSAYDYAPIENL